VGVKVDDPRRDGEATNVKDKVSRFANPTDGSDLAITNGHVAVERRQP